MSPSEYQFDIMGNSRCGWEIELRMAGFHQCFEATILNYLEWVNTLWDQAYYFHPIFCHVSAPDFDDSFTYLISALVWFCAMYMTFPFPFCWKDVVIVPDRLNSSRTFILASLTVPHCITILKALLPQQPFAWCVRFPIEVQSEFELRYWQHWYLHPVHVHMEVWVLHPSTYSIQGVSS